MSRSIAVFFLLFIALSSVFFFIGALLIWAVTRPFDSRLVWLHQYSCFWASVYVWMMPAWKVTYHGKEHIDPKRTYVVISNHQSLLDILVAFGLFFPYKWVSKIEIFKVPLIGWNMRLNRYIKLKRGDRESIKEMMVDAEWHLRNGSSVYMFPEGTRSVDGKIKAFKLGAFTLAKKTGLPILPIVIQGTTHALPKKSLDFHGFHDIQVQVLPAIEPETFAAMDDQQLSDYCRELLIRQLSSSLQQ